MSEYKDFIVNYLKSLNITLEQFHEDPEQYIDNVEIIIDADHGMSIEDYPDSYNDHNEFEIIYYFSDFNLYLRYFGESNSSMSRFWPTYVNHSGLDSLEEIIPIGKECIQWEVVKSE